MRVTAACSAVLVALSVVVAAEPSGSQRVGKQTDGSFVTPTNQRVRPAGTQITFEGRTAEAAVRPGGRTAAILSATGPAVTIVDVATSRVLQRVARHGRASNRGVAYSPDGRRLFASFDKGNVLRFDVAPDGRLHGAVTFPLPRTRTGREIVSGVAVSEGGGRLYVALNRSNTLGVLDTATGRVLARIPVGNAPTSVAVAGSVAIVTNEGGRRALRRDRTNLSAGTRIVSRPSSGGAATGTVSLVDLRTYAVRAQVPVGLHPTAVAARGRYAYVANTDSDSVSVVDVPLARVVATIAVTPFARAPFGSAVNSVATYGHDRLLVTLGRGNAVAMIRWTSPTRPARFDGMLPTGWYPTDVVVDRQQRRLVVVNSKGAGPVAVVKAGAVTKYVQHGGVSFVAFPTAADLAAGARAVTANNGWANASRSFEKPRDVAPVAVPTRVGEPSLIEHVFYVIKENRTYDQVLGDDPRGNGSTRYVQFGERVTPNQHLLATTFPLFDNFYVSGELSADAHQWATQAYASDYVERAYGAFARSYPYYGADALAYAPTGFLWENATRHGRSVRVYGEFANRDDPRKGTHSDVPSLDAVLDRSYPPFDMKVSDGERMRILLADLDKRIANGTVPNLSIVQLPQDHTHGTAPGAPTPESDMADNDVALGLLIEALSTSPIWSKTAVFVFEDDAQKGLDHVDSHRTTAFVASPYARRGVVDSTYYTQINLIRTIEQILGLPPMNQLDLVATPMFSAFTDTPVLTPFVSVPRLVPEQRNPRAEDLTGVARAWAEASATFDFSVPDLVPEDMLNHAIWYSARGWVPYPGDTRVLYPDEIG